ncbi:MAG TPA: hypothetical protein VL403_02290 [Candidatus Kryptonia bacterium]|nr:hypothetical protein [Candidatus Kryptonia bacterium]
MRFGLGKRRLAGVAVVLAGALVLARSDRSLAAELDQNSGATIDQPGAILVFPKVVYDLATATNQRDTIIQISNTFNHPADVHCFYIDARLTNPNARPDPVFNPRRWQETDFALHLTSQQPTHWVVSFGRPVDPTDFFGGQDSGLDPGAIPPVTPGFEGELRCFNVDASGNPMGGNWLKGEATILTRDRDASDYNAIALRAGDSAGNDDNVAILDEVGQDTGGRYTACPQTLILDFIAYDQPDPVVKQFGACTPSVPNPAGCPVETNLTLVPCSADFEDVIPGNVTLSVSIVDEFENTLSAPVVTVDCWLDSPLDALGTINEQANSPYSASVLGSPTAVARFTSTSGGGVLGVAEETHIDSTGDRSRAAFNLQHEGAQPGDRIVLSLP